MKWINKLKNIRSSENGIPIRACLFVFVLFMGVLPLLIMLLLSRKDIARQSRRDYDERVQMSCYQMEQRLLSVFTYDNMSMDMVYSELEHMSGLFGGRALVLNDQYRVLYDSYHLDEQKYFPERHVLEAVAKKKTLQYSNKKETQVFQPVINHAGEVRGVLVFQAGIEDVAASNHAYETKSGVLFLLLAVAILVAGYFLSAYFSRPLKEMKQSAEAFRDGQQKSIQASRYSELMETSKTINDVIDRLNEVDQSRKEFVSNVSHELKTPITSIRILADSLMQADPESTPVELYREFMTDISAELDRETKIINDLLSMVRLDESAVKMNFAMTDMHVMLEQLLKRLQPIAQEREVELVLESFRQVEAPVDETKLSLAISNLIENSIKYNRKDGWVHVSLNADHKYFYIKIEDSGIGIPTEEQNKIFDRFYRVDKARSRETGGTGLGLAITKSVVLLHHGIIRVFSKVDEGTTFQVRIPLSMTVASEPEQSRREEHQEQGDEEV